MAGLWAIKVRNKLYLGEKGEQSFWEGTELVPGQTQSIPLVTG